MGVGVGAKLVKCKGYWLVLSAGAKRHAVPWRALTCRTLRGQHAVAGRDGARQRERAVEPSAHATSQHVATRLRLASLRDA